MAGSVIEIVGPVKLESRGIQAKMAAATGMKMSVAGVAGQGRLE